MDTETETLSGGGGGPSTSSSTSEEEEEEVKIISSRRSWSWSNPFPRLNVFKYLLVEPICLLQGIAGSLTVVIIQNLYIDRICRVTHGLPDAVCGNLTSYPQEEKLVEADTSSYTMYYSLIESGFPILISLFLGPWIDKHGEKGALLLTLVGWIASSVLRIIFTLLPSLGPEYLLLSSLPVGLTGGYNVFTITTFSFMSSKTSIKSRTFRLAFLGVIWDVGGPIGLILGDQIFLQWGFLAVFATAAVIFLLALLYGMVTMPRDSISELSAVLETDSSSNCCARIFNVGAVSDTICTFLRRRSGRQRCCLLLLTFSICLNIFAYQGAANFKYLFTRNKFGWDTDVYSDYATISALLGIVGGNLLIFTTMKCLRLGDVAIGISSTLSGLAGYLLIAFSANWWQMYLAAAVQMFGTVITGLNRSIISKCVPRDEFGKVFSVVTLLELATPFATTPLFSVVYSSTIAVLPGAIFLLCAGALVVIIANFLYVHFTMRNMETLLTDTDAS